MGVWTLQRSSISAVPSRRYSLVDSYWPLAPVLVAVALLLAPTLVQPFGPDQAIFATIADTINRGGFPFVDAWDQKPPGIYLLYSLALRLPGPLMVRVRVFDAAWTLATVVLVYELARGFWSPRAGVMAALLYGAVYATIQGFWYLAQPDGLLALPLLGALLLYSRAGTHWRGKVACLIAGMLVGFAFQLRFTAAPLLPAFALVMAYECPRGRRRWLRRTTWLVAGFLLSQLALALYLVAGSALGAYLEAMRFASGYATTGWPFAPRERTPALFLAYARSATLSWLTAQVMLTLPALAGGFAAFAIKRDAAARAITAMALCAYAGIAIQQKFFWYHWQIVLPLLAMLAGWALDQVLTRIEVHTRPGPAMAAKAVLIGGFVLATPDVTNGAFSQWNDLLHRDDTRLTRVRYDNQFGAFGDRTYSYLADRQVSAYVRDRTNSDDQIYVFGYDPLIYLLSNRQSASRFIYALPLMSDWAPSGWQEEFVNSIRIAAPRYIAVQSYEGAATWITGQSEDTAAWAWKIDAFAALLTDQYEHEIDIEHFSLYRRKAP